MKKVYIVRLVLMAVVIFFSTGLFGQTTTWYALNSGNWDDHNNWTLDPASAVYHNPGATYPKFATDNVVIKTGLTITVPVKDPVINLSCGILTVDGRLDLGLTSGHQFIAIRGNGRILMQNDNFPAGDATHFITKGQGEGTVVFQGNSFAITNPRTFYNMEVEMSAGQTLALGANVTTNGNLQVVNGTLDVGNSTTARTLVVSGNVTVDSGATFGVGIVNATHSLEIFGNFTNNGTVQFSNSAQYAAANNGAVKVLFRGTSNNSLIANGTTNFYRMIVNKGIDQSYILSVSANSTSNFKLFGPVTGTAGLDAADGTLGWEQLPIVLRNGTLKLENNIDIPQLGYNRGNNNPKEFTIPATAGLWIDGANVTTAPTLVSGVEWSGITVRGTLRVSSGILTTPANSAGITYSANATTPAALIVEGGTLNLTNIRRRDTEGLLNFSQSAGTINFLTAGYYHNIWGNNGQNAVFSLPDSRQAFEMSGGSMVFGIANDGHVGGINIESQDGNYFVTGGTIEVRVPTGRDFKILSKAPFYNLSTVSTGSTQKVWMTNLYGDNNTYFDGNLVVLNDLVVAAGTAFDPGSYNLFLGRNLNINGTFATGGKITLNGSANGTVTNNSAIFTINKLFVEKEQPSALINLAGTGNFAISDSLVLVSGNLNLGSKQVPAQGHISILNGSILNSDSGRLVLSGNTSRNLFSAKGKDLSFGVIELNKTSTAPHITLSSAAKAREVIFTGNQVMNLDIHNLEIEVAGTYKDQAWSANRMFRTAGNASDGGLTLPVVLNGNYGASNNATGTEVQVFPVGVGSNYHSMTLFARNTLNNSGTIRVVPVNDKHPTVDDSKKNDAIEFYWRVWNGLDVANTSLRYYFNYGINIPNNIQTARVLSDFVWSSPGGSFPGNNSISFNFGAPLEQDYTAGNQSAFNSITRLYSKTSGNWNNAATWTTNADHATGTGSIPKSYDVVIIGGAGAANHNVTISASNAVASQVYIKGKSETNIGVGNDGVAPPTLTIAHNTSGHNIDLIKGHGRIVHENNYTYWSDYPRINGDYSEFCISNEAILEFTGTGAGPRIMPPNSIIPVYPNLHFTGTAGTTQFNGGDLKVIGNLVVASTTFNLPAINNGMVTVDGNVIINNGTLGFTTGYNHHMTINGNLLFTGNGTFNGQSGSADKNLFLKGNLSLGNGNIQFNNTQKINLVLTGNNSATYSKGSGTANFFRVIVDKPVGQKVHFTAPFNLGAGSDGATKAFVLKSGMAHLDNSGIDINLSTGGADFRIPSTAILNVDNGAKINIGGVTNTGLWLDGSLILNNGAEAKFDNGTGSGLDNYIQYTASGSPSIWIGNGAKLSVGSQIRRQTTTTAGSLSFTQAHSNTTIQIGTKSAPVNNRGVFEILNEGSSFTQTEANSVISILRAQTSPTVSALYFNPASASIATGSGFVVGGAVEGQTIGVLAGKPLQNLILSASNNPVAQVMTLPLVINETLTINNGATFNANGLDVTIKGNLVNSGTYLAAGNTTYFTSVSPQSITGASTFFNFVKQGSGAISLGAASNITIDNNLDLVTGSFNTGENSVIVNGNASINAGFVTSSSGASEGFVLQGGVQQRLSGSGTFARLTIDNPAGVFVPTQSSSVNYSEALRLKQGVLDIGRNLMIIEKNAAIVAVNPFSSGNMIQTNLSFTDAGIRKYLPSGALAEPLVFPIGSAGKFTPVTLNISGNASDNGYIRVKAANEPHITVLDQSNVLNYNWTLDAANISGFSAGVVMQAIPTDALVSLPNTLSDYIAARILAGSADWNKLDNIYDNGTLIEGFNKDDYQVVFRFNNTGTSLINGDYTAGIRNAIPDQIPSYVTVKNGDWTDASTWAVFNPQTGTVGDGGVFVPDGGPRGSLIVINHNLSLTQNFMSSFRTRINGTGRMLVGNTLNHRLGDVSGTGTLVLQSGSFPAGVYDSFFSATGGTVEFTGSGEYDVLSEIPIVNNLIFSGTGTRRQANLDLILNGSLTIDGPLLVNEFNKKTSIRRDIILNSGSYNAKDGTVEVSGSVPQTIGGAASFAGASSFNDFVVNNLSGVTLQKSLAIKRNLTFVNGIINSTSTAQLILSSTANDVLTGVSSTSYVNGPVVKNVNNGSSFTFPTGKDGRFGQLGINEVGVSGLWEVEYFNTGAPDRATFDSSVKYVSSNEYWKVTAPVSDVNAKVTLRWDANSGVNPDDDAFRVASSVESSAWSAINYTDRVGTMAGGTLKTVQSSLSPVRRFTFASNNVDAYTWLGSISNNWFIGGNWAGGAVPSASNNAIVANSSNNPVINSGAVAQTNDLTINSGAILTLAPGGKLTVNRNLEIAQPGGLVLENETGTNKMASLITYGTVNGQANMKLTLPPNRWFYLGSSIKEPVFSNFGAGNADVIINVFRNGSWWGIGSGLASRLLRPMEGIVTNLLNDGSQNRFINYTGQLHTTAVSRTFAETGFHLFANPYPSFISWEDAPGWERSAIDGTIWYRGKVGDEMAFITYNRNAVPNAKVALYPDGIVTQTTEQELSLIPPMQAVWVRALSANANLTVGTETRRHGVTGSMLKSSSSRHEGDVIRIESENSFSRDGMVIYFASASEEGVDAGDSEKYFNDSERIPEIFTRVGDKSLAINGLPSLVAGTRIIPLSVRNRVEGDVTLRFSLDNYYGYHSPYLKDNETGAFVHLLHENSYTYSVTRTGDDHDRFELHFYYVTTDLEPVVEDPETVAGISIRGVAGKALVSIQSDLLQTGEALIEVFSIEGSKVSEMTARSSRTLVVLPQASGIYIVRVTLGSLSKSERVFGRVR
jgi:hypothetical protein